MQRIGRIMKNFQHLCSWTTALIFKSVKKRLLVVLCTLSILYIILRWRLTCVDIHSQMQVQRMCTTYAIGISVGSLCHSLCKDSETTSVSCPTFYQATEVVSGNWPNQSVIYRNVAETNDLAHLDASGRTIFPSEEEFTNMIKNAVKLKFNISISDVDARKMSYLQNKEDMLRQIEMQNVWSLLQDNEYLVSLLYEKYNIFPKLLGTCGYTYAVQKMQSISGYWHLMTLYDSEHEWNKRIKTALLILDYLSILEEKLPEPVHICDVKMSHFVFTSDFKKIVYQDVESIHPQSMVNRITGGKSECEQHSDCDFMDCRSFCNLVSQKCDHGVVNNNLQIVCEKIFLGWVISGRVMVPGLLLGPRSPKVLVEMLDLCANPERTQGTPRAKASKEIRKRLYDLLSNLKLY
ncbi:divergent protein kinase domain 1C isoform X1 [Amyelois transitella]|uniref:divergent protein kinase domain 1C isoform X1 n=2 Tax=Amyelois transitella TaxID=680683 RepID=UPI0029901854|nr:divergent protein kinase domain 1C isoform X1 [Amyelois transitella]